MRKVVEFLRENLHHEKLHAIDKNNIEKCIAEFDLELSKVAAPAIVEKRIVNVEDGNPSDSNYKKKKDEPAEKDKAGKNFKLKVKSNRGNLNSITEERIEIKGEPEEKLKPASSIVDFAQTITESYLDDDTEDFLKSLHVAEEIEQKRVLKEKAEATKPALIEAQTSDSSKIEKEKMIQYVDKPVQKKKVKFAEEEESK